MRYVLSRYKRYERDEAYRVYITDLLRAYFKRSFSIDGDVPRYVDLFKPVDMRSAEDIKSSIQEKLARMGGEE